MMISLKTTQTDNLRLRERMPRNLGRLTKETDAAMITAATRGKT